MKALTDYPTPETDAVFEAIGYANHPETDGEHFRAFMKSARNGVESLERRLAACREALQQVKETSSSTRLRRIATEALSLTKPLAELKK